MKPFIKPQLYPAFTYSSPATNTFSCSWTHSFIYLTLEYSSTLKGQVYPTFTHATRPTPRLPTRVPWRCAVSGRKWNEYSSKIKKINKIGRNSIKLFSTPKFAANFLFFFVWSVRWTQGNAAFSLRRTRGSDHFQEIREYVDIEFLEVKKRV